MFNKFNAALILVISAICLICGAASAAATTTSTTCASGYTCIPANTTVSKSSNSSSSSFTKVVIEKTIKEDVEEYEQTTHKVVGFDMNVAPTSHGMTDCHWGDYAWSGWTLINGKVVYKKIPPHGRTHVCWNGKNWIQTGGGDKQWNCGNIDYPYGDTPPEKEQVEDIVTFHTRDQFIETFKKWVTSHHHSTSTTSSKTLYSCTAGWSLHGTQCWQAVTPPTTTTPAPTVSCPTGTSLNSNGNCVAAVVNCPSGTTMNSAGNCVAVAVSCPTGTVTDSSGNCVTQTNTAAQNCEAEGGTYSTTNQTCTIIQTTGNCSTITVINGSGDTSTTNSPGNCNTTVTPPATPEVSLGGFPNFNEIQAGGNSGTEPLCVPTYASDGNASVTISSDLGFVAASASATDPQSGMTEPANEGNGEACFVLFAPNDSDKPASMTVTVKIMDGTAAPASETSDPIGITYPETTRPS